MLEKSKVYVISPTFLDHYKWLRSEQFKSKDHSMNSKGQVARVIRDKGFGFIRTDNGEELFFHRSECKDMFDRMNEGDNVEFERVDSSKGPRANSVRVL